MRNRYSIIFGTVMVTGLLFLVETVVHNNNSLTTNLFIIILLAVGYIVTYTSSTLKTRTAIFSGFSVGIIIMIYQLLFNRSVLDPTILIAYLILPGFFMMIGGFTAKITKKQIVKLTEDFMKRKAEDNSKSRGK